MNAIAEDPADDTNPSAYEPIPVHGDDVVLTPIQQEIMRAAVPGKILVVYRTDPEAPRGCSFLAAYLSQRAGWIPCYQDAIVYTTIGGPSGNVPATLGLCLLCVGRVWFQKHLRLSRGLNGIIMAGLTLIVVVTLCCVSTTISVTVARHAAKKHTSMPVRWVV